MMIIRKLKQKQKEEGLSDKTFALKLGVHRMTWYRIRTRKTGISIDFLRRAVLIYPDLKEEASIFLTSNVATATKRADK